MNNTDILPPTLDTPEFRAAWSEWQDHRKELKKNTTLRINRAALRKLERYESAMGVGAAIAAIEHSMANGYQGLFHDPAFRPAPKKASRGGSSHREPHELWRDAAKAASRDDLDYWAFALSLHDEDPVSTANAVAMHIQRLDSFYSLPMSLRQATLAAAKHRAFKLWT